MAINGVVPRQTVAGMGPFQRPGTHADSQGTLRASATIHVAARSRDYRTGSAFPRQLPHKLLTACGKHACVRTDLK